MKGYPIDLTKAQEFLLGTIVEAGEILRKYFHFETLKKKPKGDHDIVTEADLAADSFIIKKFRKKFPDIPMLTEETSVGDFEKYKNMDVVWLVDPLDGTTNFCRRFPHFAVSIGLVFQSYPILGAVYNPIYKNLYWAREGGSGAFLNGRQIHVSKEVNPYDSIICVDWSHDVASRDKIAATIQKLVGRVGHIKILGSAATDTASVASGQIEAYAHSHCLPWDTAAAALIAQKAGAKVTDICGGKWNVFTPGILAANPILHQKILKLLQ